MYKNQKHINVRFISIKKQAFTLVELIVVITILAILGTIAFLSFQGYTRDARDSVRTTDLANINKAFNLQLIKRGKISISDDKINITVSGAIIGYQGYINNSLLSKIGISLNTKDPLDGAYYTYITGKNLNTYQILGYLESNLVYNIENNLINNVFAADYNNRTPKILGDNLGVLVDSQSLIPVQISLIDIDILNTNKTLIAYISDNESIIGTGREIAKIGSRLENFKSCKGILKKYGKNINNGIYKIHENINNGYESYCDMSNFTKINKINEVNKCDYYISTTGNDINNGKTLLTPFLTLEKARDTIRSFKRNNTIPQGGLVACLRGGKYFRGTSFLLDSRDSGDNVNSIIYKPYNNEKVRIIGGIEINSNSFSKLNNTSNVWNRLDILAKGNVYSVDLGNNYTTNYGTLKKRGYGSPAISGLELFVNSEPMTLARRPDVNYSYKPKAQTFNDNKIDIQGISNISGIFSKYLKSDNVNSYKRDNLISGLQYYLHRRTWEYPVNTGTMYTAWFISTDYGRYPSANDPWFSSYKDTLSDITFNPSNGAIGNPTTKNTTVDTIVDGFSSIKEAISINGAKANKFKYYGNRPSRWILAEDLWFHGYWYYPWSESHIKSTNINTLTNTITLNKTPVYGIKNGLYYYAENLLEEITTPGEWYLNRTTGILYFWPKNNLYTSEIIISTIEQPLLKISNGSNIIFDNIIFEDGRSDLIDIVGDNIIISNSTIRNSGQNGIKIDGYNNNITYSKVYNTGESGIHINGKTTDLNLLKNANNIIDNNEIYKIARWGWTYFTGIKISNGVGNILKNNNIYNMPHTAILFTGNENIIEYNNIYNVNKFSSDAGSIYTGRSWGWRGNIIKNNYIHDIKTNFDGYGVHGIYLDDIVSGEKVISNIFSNISGYGLMTGGGRDNIMESNIFINTKGFHTDCRGVDRITNIPGNSFNLLEKINLYNYKTGIWAIKYPFLAKIPNNWSQINSEKLNNYIPGTPTLKKAGKWLYPEGSTFSKNIGYGNSGWINDSCSSAQAKNTFKDISNNIESGSGIFDKNNLGNILRVNGNIGGIKGFKKTYFNNIGIQK